MIMLDSQRPPCGVTKGGKGRWRHNLDVNYEVDRCRAVPPNTCWVTRVYEDLCRAQRSTGQCPAGHTTIIEAPVAYDYPPRGHLFSGRLG